MADARSPGSVFSAHPGCLPPGGGPHADLRVAADLWRRLSHEIRNPLNTIVGFADFLHQHDNTLTQRERREATEGLLRNARSLHRLADRALELAQLDAGGARLNNRPCELALLLRSARNRAARAARPKRVAVMLRARGRLPRDVWLDPARLEAILDYLLEYAVKFTEAAEVRVVVRVVQRAVLDSVLVVRILDSGIGIGRASVKRTHLPSFLEGQAAWNAYSAENLGLAIGHRLARLMGGGLKVRSTPCSGSAFTLTLPIPRPAADNWIDRLEEPAAAPAPPVAAAASNTGRPAELRGRRVLVAEDGPDNQRLISFVLQRGGAVVTMAENGRAACDLALEQRDRGTPYDVILMDMHMPVLDGYAATQLLRSAGYRGPIIAVTAYTGPHERMRCLACGCDEFLSKPVVRDTLFRTILERLR